MPDVTIGCSGFSYKHWKKVFYPEDLPERQWLDLLQPQFLLGRAERHVLPPSVRIRLSSLVPLHSARVHLLPLREADTSRT